MNERELRAYLLGQATEEQAVRLEARLLEDDELFQVLESIEDDLFDDHARGRLDRADRARFEARYGADGQRQRFARALSARVAEASTAVPFRPRPAWRRWAPLAAAAVIVLVAGGLVLTRSGARGTAGPSSAQAPQPVPEPAGKTGVFALTLATSRAAGEPVLLTITSDMSRLEFRVRLNPADRFGSYEMDLRSAATATIVWRSADLHAAPENGDLMLTAPARAGDVQEGTYELAVRGIRAGGTAASAEDLGFVPIKVVQVR